MGGGGEKIEGEEAEGVKQEKRPEEKERQKKEGEEEEEKYKEKSKVEEAEEVEGEEEGEEEVGKGAGGGTLPRSFHGAEMELCAAHASSVASAVGGSLSQGCLFATLYVSEEAAAAAAAVTAVGSGAGAGGEEVGTEGARMGDRKLASRGGSSASIEKNADSEAFSTEGALSLRTKSQTQDQSQDYSQDYSQFQSQDQSQANVERANNVEAMAKGGWLQAMVDECRLRMEERFPQERAEAVAEVAGRSGGDGGVGDEDEDSAEEGWTSDAEELAKEAARKAVSGRI